MSKRILVLILLAFSCIAAAQTPDKEASDAKLMTFYKLGPNELYLFDPYSAEYAFGGNIFGVPFRLFSLSTDIRERPGEWQETQYYKFDVFEMLADGDEDSKWNSLSEIEVTSDIDIGTGLLRRLAARIGGKYAAESVLDLSEPGRIVATTTDRKRSKTKVFETRERIYPCSFSNAFFSYLPLHDDFAGSFACIDINADADSDKDLIRFNRRTLRVVGSETVTVDAGTFDCYKLTDDTEELRYDKAGMPMAKKRAKQGEFDPDSIWKSAFNHIWIDKRSRKVVKAELKFKHGNVLLELQPSNGRDL